jgi:predicted TIM-barrel fold metal-dependent hydrolase
MTRPVHWRRRSGIWDCHIHVGQFRESFFSPAHVAEVVNRLCLEGIVASSTTSATGDYERAHAELTELAERCRAHVVKLIWITDALLRSKRRMERILQHGYAGIKLHGDVDGWMPQARQYDRACMIARERGLPILVHTGYDSHVAISALSRLCEDCPDIRVVFAHARPAEDAAAVLERHSNAFVDTAFARLSDIRRIVRSTSASRVLYGSDFPITTHYAKSSPLQLFKAQHKRWATGFPFDDWERISRLNTTAVFGDEH